MAKKNIAAANVNNSKLVELIVAEVIKSINLEEVVAQVVASNAAPAQETAREAKPARKSQTREEALTERYGDAEHRKAAVATMKDCYDKSWSNWIAYRDAHKDAWTRAQIKAANQTVSGLARKAGYAGEVLKKGFFADLMAKALA